MAKGDKKKKNMVQGSRRRLRLLLLARCILIPPIALSFAMSICLVRGSKALVRSPPQDAERSHPGLLILAYYCVLIFRASSRWAGTTAATLTGDATSLLFASIGYIQGWPLLIEQQLALCALISFAGTSTFCCIRQPVSLLSAWPSI